MNQRDLRDIKGCLYELAHDNLCGATKGAFLQDVEDLFKYINELQITNKQLRTKITQLRKEIN